MVWCENLLSLVRQLARLLQSGENIFVDERSYARRVLDVVDEVVAEKLAQAV